MDRIKNKGRIGIFASIFFVFLYTFIYDDLIFSDNWGADSTLVSVVSLSSVIVLVGLAILAMKKPESLSGILLNTASVSCAILGAVLILTGTPQPTPSLIVGALLVEIGFDWGLVAACLVMSVLPTRTIALFSSAGAIAAYAISVALSFLPHDAMIAVYLICGPCVVLPIMHVVNPLLESLRKTVPQDEVRITRPTTWVPFNGTLFVSFFIFMIFYGFGLFGLTGQEAVQGSFAACIIAAAMSFLVIRKSMYMDYIYLVSALFVLLGIFMLFLQGSLYAIFGSTAFRMAAICFYFLQMFTWGAMAAKNRQSALASIAWGSAICLLGNEVGWILRGAVNTLGRIDQQLSLAIASVFGLTFIAYIFFGMHDFSLYKTVHNIEPAKAATIARDNSAESMCAAVAENFGLTNRESEILVFLARGRNCSIIEQELTISRNTVRSHVRHIYEKLDVHSQQELIDFVEKNAGTTS